MASCDAPDCEGDKLLRFECNECGGTFCTTHRLPESHSCSALRSSGAGTNKRFSTGLQEKSGTKRGLTKRETDRNTGPTASQQSEQSNSGDASNESVPSDHSRRGGGQEGTDRRDETAPRRESESEIRSNTNPPSRVWHQVGVWSLGILTAVSQAVSARVRSILAWVWWVVTGLARLVGAGMTLIGLGWLLGMILPPVFASGTAFPISNYQPVILLLVGVVLVQATKNRAV